MDKELIDSGEIFSTYKETPLTYVKVALKINGLQDYIDAVNEFN